MSVESKSGSYNADDTENKVLDYWKSKKIYAQAKKKTAKGKIFYFLDGLFDFFEQVAFTIPEAVHHGLVQLGAGEVHVVLEVVNIGAHAVLGGFPGHFHELFPLVFQ